jgi:broad specificity phosphatase PhoE
MPTAWNVAGRLQGRADPELSCETLPDWRLPPEFACIRWLTSPLARALATARHLGVAAQPDPRLTEMAWGEWEGRTLADLRACLGAAMATEEGKGRDFRPPGGESPRDVQRRVVPLLAEIAASRQPTAAITHKGVIRAVLSLATGWDMLGKPPHRLAWSAVHLFRLDPTGHPSVERVNLPLDGA